MDFVIKLLETYKKEINKNIHTNDLMRTDMKKANEELSRITEIRKAIRILKSKK